MLIICSALKTGGEEILRERWDEATQGDGNPDASMEVDPVAPRASQWLNRSGSILPDWSQAPLPLGAPSTTAIASTPLIAVS
jgi:actin-related protein 10